MARGPQDSWRGRRLPAGWAPTALASVTGRDSRGPEGPTWTQGKGPSAGGRLRGQNPACGSFPRPQGSSRACATTTRNESPQRGSPGLLGQECQASMVVRELKATVPGESGWPPGSPRGARIFTGMPPCVVNEQGWQAGLSWPPSRGPMTCTCWSPLRTCSRDDSCSVLRSEWGSLTWAWARSAEPPAGPAPTPLAPPLPSQCLTSRP